MFRASSAHLQEDIVVYKQHMLLSLSMSVPGGLSVHSLSENWLEGERAWACSWQIQSCVEVKNEWSCTSGLPYAFTFFSQK